jgi:PAS domain S-box-containing protein/putative nucleotidyltransferase with HDIG domain
MEKMPGIQKKTWINIGLGVLALITIIGFSLWNIYLQDQKSRDDLLQQAENISQAINSDVLHQLTGIPEDKSSPYYQQLKQQLIATRRIYPDVRFMYILSQKEDGSIFFYIDSEPSGSPDESLPGDLFTYPGEDIIETLKTGSSVALGPGTDKYGTWRTAIAPIRDSSSGEVVAAFGMNVDAADWFTQAAKSASQPILIFLTLIILIIGTTHIFQYRQKKPETYRKHFFTLYAPVICTGLLGICLTVLLAWYAQSGDNRDREYSFDRLAGFQSEIITSAIASVDSVGLESFKQFYQGSDFVTREEFSKFTEHLLRDPFIAAWAWIPQVQNEQLEAIKTSAQQEGLSQFEVWQWSPSNSKVPSISEDPAFPILYLSPHDLEEELLGYNMVSIESQNKILKCAMEKGNTCASDPSTFSYLNNEPNLIFIYKPIKPEDNPSGQVGIVAAIVFSDQILEGIRLESIQYQGDPEDIGLYTDLFQIYPDKDIQLLSSTSPDHYQQTYLSSNLHDHQYAEFTFVKPLFLFGNTYVIVSHPSPDFYQSYPASDGLIVFVAGIVLTFMAMLLIGNYANRNYILRDRVQQRTAELEESERKFQIALKNSPVVVFQQDRELRYEWIHNPNPGFEAKEVIGKTDYDLLPYDEANQLAQIKRRVIESGKGTQQIVRITINGRAYHYNLTIEPIQNTTGKCIGVTCSSVDITDIVEAHDATIESWSMALELRDQETEGHTLRVTEMTIQMAEALGVGEDELTHIRRGALLHDIGKIGIPDSILLKPGELTDEEWEIMKQHPVFAYNMLSEIEYLEPALDIPFCHHERWDGTGYPRGLKGEAIPLAARIFAVIDVWDALLSDRPYRDAWPEDKVRDYIRAQSGTHFDPAVVDVFFTMVDSFTRE